MNGNFRSAAIKFITAAVIFAVLLTSCSQLNESTSQITDAVNNIFQSPTATSISEESETTPTMTAADTPTATAPVPEETPEEIPSPTPESYVIRLWVPPQFDVEQDTPGGKALAEAIVNYTELHPNITISTRVKAAGGDSSAINTLTAASHVAKDSLPSLVLLSRSDMETAVQRGIAQPITTSIFSDNSSWYGYSRQSAIIDNTIYSIPIFGDCLVLTYRPAKTGSDLSDWQDILTRGLPIGFAPASSSSYFGTFIYLTQGSKLTNDQGQFYLDQQKLTDTLNFFLSGGQNGAFPPSLAQLVDQNQVWQRFNDGTMSIIVSQFSSFRHYQTDTISVRAMPVTDEGADYPLITTWNLVMTEDNAALQEETIKFAEYLSDININDSLSVSAGYLPVRRSDHTFWQDDPQADLINTISEYGVLIPNNQIINKLVPIINNAVIQVIKNQQTPETAAQEAISSLN